MALPPYFETNQLIKQIKDSLPEAAGGKSGGKSSDSSEGSKVPMWAICILFIAIAIVPRLNFWGPAPEIEPATSSAAVVEVVPEETPTPMLEPTPAESRSATLNIIIHQLYIFCPILAAFAFVLILFNLTKVLLGSESLDDINSILIINLIICVFLFSLPVLVKSIASWFDWL